MIKTSVLALAFAGLLAAAPSFAASAAKTVPAVPAAPVVTAPAAPDAMKAMDDKKMKSHKCSMEADKQGLHGKMRKKFRETCKKAA